MIGTAVSAAAGAASGSVESVGIPAGFGELARERELLVDLYFGGRKIGEARAVARPGFLKFRDAQEIIALIPNLEPSAEVAEAVRAELPTNAALVCPEGGSPGCGRLSPQAAGIIFDEDRFRVDLFVNPKWLRLIRSGADEFLRAPTAPLSVTSSSGFALSGSNDRAAAYNFQNRTIVGLRNARLRSDSSYASGLGLVMDSFVGEVDVPGLRYSAGLFWAPGLDLTGQRRIVGIGAGTQFDTRADRDNLRGTPIVLFLPRASQVEILVDGRLVASKSYDAGNNVIETSTLPDGSYSLLLRIHEPDGGVREERRFFAKNVQIAPVGQPIYFGYAGLLANTRPGHAISLSNELFYQFGTARRLTDHLALDAAVIGTARKPLFEAGAWLIGGFGRMRIAAIASSRGDHGALLQLVSSGSGPLAASLDIRRIWSSDGTPLIPLSTPADTFASAPIDERQSGAGSYTQASGSIGYRLGSAYLSVIGSLRRDGRAASDYSIGPNVSWPFVNSKGVQITLHSDAQLTRTSTAGYLGFTMLVTRGRYSVTSSAGARATRGGGQADSSRAVADSTAHFSYSSDSGTDLSLAAGVARDLDSTTAHAEGVLYSRLGTARADILRDFDGRGRTQYGLSLQTGAILSSGRAVVGGRNLTDSALMVAIDGSDAAEFEVLVDGQPRARLRAGGQQPIFLQPYRAYSVRLRAANAASTWYDEKARDVILFPGNVQQLRWQVEHLVTVFGRAVRADGTPVADAVVTSGRGIGQSNSDGYFQVETSANDMLSFERGRGQQCKAELKALEGGRDFVRVGRVLCR